MFDDAFSATMMLHVVLKCLQLFYCLVIYGM